MTYLQFHFVFILPVIAALALLQARPMAGVGARQALGWLAVITGIAFVYTTPWDNYLVYRGVWGYGNERVIGTIGYVPIEEYMFFILQPIMTGLLYFLFRGRGWLDAPLSSEPPAFRSLITGGWIVLSIIGIICLIIPNDSSLYMGLILAWASPVLAGMGWIGASKIWSERRRLAVVISLSTLYLWIADRTAINLGIWDIATRYSFDFIPFGLPIEEAVFFLVTNILCAQGLAMFLPTTASVHDPQLAGHP